MIPLSLDTGGSCVVGRGRRSAWVCEKPDCVKAVSESPGPASRAFRTRARPSKDLTVQVHTWRAERHIRALRAAYRSGSLIVSSGAHRDSYRGDILWVTTHDHPAGPPQPLTENNKNVRSTLTIAANSAEIAEVTGRPGCTLLGIRPGRATQSLIDTLRRWHHLGYLAGLREEGPSTGYQPGLNKAVKESHVDQGPHRTTQSYPDDYPT